MESRKALLRGKIHREVFENFAGKFLSNFPAISAENLDSFAKSDSMNLFTVYDAKYLEREAVRNATLAPYFAHLCAPPYSTELSVATLQRIAPALFAHRRPTSHRRARLAHASRTPRGSRLGSRVLHVSRASRAPPRDHPLRSAATCASAKRILL